MVDSTASSANYEVWRTPWGDVAHIPYIYPFAFKFEREYWNPYYFFGAFNLYWHYSFIICAIYIGIIHATQHWMRNRKPMNLRTPLVLWNTTLAIFSSIATWRFGQECLYVLRNRPFIDSICLSMDPREPAGFWALLFALSKVFELVDTFFVVLRKRPLIFLHWYHHAVVLIYSWHSAVGLTAAGRYFMTINYFVHSLMYTYYAISACGFRAPRIVAMGVTSLQTLQMFVGVLLSVSVAVLKIDSYLKGTELICQQSNSNLALCFFIYFTFALLFMKFFKGAYLKKKEPAKDGQPILANGSSANGNLSQPNGSISSNGSAKTTSRKDKSA